MGLENTSNFSGIGISLSENQNTRFKSFETGLAQITLRYVYITNNVTNESQLDAYLNQKATTYKKVETGTAKQWIQYSFTMSDEEYVELINRNNNLRIYSQSDVQESTFSHENIEYTTIPFETTIAAGAFSDFTAVSSTDVSNNFIYLSYLFLSISDSVTRHSWRIRNNVTSLFLAYVTRESTVELRNTLWPSTSNAVVFRFENNAAFAVTIRGWISYYRVNRV